VEEIWRLLGEAHLKGWMDFCWLSRDTCLVFESRWGSCAETRCQEPCKRHDHLLRIALCLAQRSVMISWPGATACYSCRHLIRWSTRRGDVAGATRRSFCTPMDGDE